MIETSTTRHAAIRENGHYWVRWGGADWTVAQWWDDCWMVIGNLSLPSDDELEGLQVGPRLIPPA